MPKRRKGFPVTRFICPHCGNWILLKKHYSIDKTPEDRAKAKAERRSNREKREKDGN